MRGDSVELQQAAFNCFLTYRYSYLSPYAEYFNALFDKKKFRDGLIHFSIDESHSTIEEVHRKDLIPYLMKVLHGQLMVKKQGYKSRVVAIMNYLAGCTASELDVFFEEIFEVLIEHSKLKRNLGEQDIVNFCDSINKNYDLTNALSPRRLTRLVCFHFI